MNHNPNEPVLSKSDIPSPRAGANWPIALADLHKYRVRGALRMQWVVRVCPICGESGHRHGAGAAEVNPIRLLSHRAAPCRIPNGGYILADADPGRTAQLVATLGL